ncbi:MAG: MCE family protein [Deltaproteobacteria bacterium]|nr:MCE family protein [Deltaproteobacteria bacterium]
MPDERIQSSAVPESRTLSRGRTRISLVWVIPIVAALVGAWVAITRIESEGPKITIVFHSAEGLDAGKTKIKYMGVDVGTITSIQLSPDHQQVLATAQMAPKTEDFLVEDTQFWVVRPRISGANITGLGTLISGAYLGMEIGNSKREKRDFVALQIPPVVTIDVPGRFFMLKTPDLGSLDTGTPVFFRRLQVGEVTGYALDKDGRLFSVKIFVRAPYDQYVTPTTRFWQASGIDMQLSASGLSVETQSLLSILIGGVAFETPARGPVLPAAGENAVFTLFVSRAQAFEAPIRSPQTFKLIFNGSVRGLAPGAPVEMRGIKVGEVVDIRAQVDAKTLKFSVPVIIQLDAQRLGVKVFDLKQSMDFSALRRKLIDSMVAHGARAQLQSGNLLTGSALIAFDFFRGVPPATVDWSQNPPELPTTPGQLEAVETSVGNIVQKIDKMPLQQIGDNLNKSLANLDLTLLSARGTLNNAKTTLNNANTALNRASTALNSANGLVEPNSAELEEIGQTLQEVRRAARSLRILADYLEQHPDALIRGKRGEAQ